MEEKDFYYKNLSCCSLILCWTHENKDKDDNNYYEYVIYKNDDAIYKGKDTSYKVINLKSNEEYIFILRILKNGKFINENEKKLKVKTLKSPIAILSERSVEISNGKEIKETNELSESQKEIIRNCSKLIYGKNKEDFIQGNFDGIVIKIAYEIEKKRHYISFDINPDKFEKYFIKFVEECKNNVIVPFYFIIQKLPTILIFNLLEKGPVILTGNRMGGAIASSLAFYIVCIGKEINYGNSFINNEKNCIGVVTFGSPSFLTNLQAADINKDITPYFYNIKYEFDYIPEFIDFINKEQNYKDILNIFNKIELDQNDEDILKQFLIKNNFTEKNLKYLIKKSIKIPFGYYFMMKGDSGFYLNPINEQSFEEFYYLKFFHSKDCVNNSKIYEKLSSETVFQKESLEYLEKDSQLEVIKIIRRNYKSDLIKGIIKFELNKNIPPDIITKIILKSYNEIYEINDKDIYYDNYTDITAYIDNLNENITYAIIENGFGGKIKIQNILNIQGSGQTRKMLKDCIEKLFLFPYFKLIEIFYTSSKENEYFNELNYKKLKKENFGENFDNIKTIKPFEKQIQIINKLLFLTRPDILGKFESKFIKEYLNENLDDEERKNNLDKKFEIYYKQANKIQKENKINCIDSEKNSFAKKYSFPQNIKGIKDIKKLFMFNHDYFKNNNFILNELDDTYISLFFIERLIKDSLQKIETDILNNININKKSGDQIKKTLSENIDSYFKRQIISNIDFIYILILSSIESGDEIKFNHNIDWKKFSLKDMSLSFLIIYLLNTKGMLNYEKDFEKYYKNEQIEAFHMKNLFHKTKTKNIIKSNMSQIINKKINEPSFSQKFLESFIPCFIMNFRDVLCIKDNKTYNFSEYSEKQKYGKEYYEKFLELLNNYSNDFQEDIEISIYDNLKEENIKGEKNFSTIKEMMNGLIDDEESKKGFLALLRQSYLIGKLRTSVVSI